MTSLLEKYRPRVLSDLLGQSWIAHQLTQFAESPYLCAFLFEGGTGTGKTSGALLLAEALGVHVSEAEFGGLHQIASGEQTGETVRRKMNALHTRPFFGSGWKVLIVNEADVMTANASVVWLDALEDLPPKTVVIFTTNNSAKIPARLRDRCERMEFESSALLLRPSLEELIVRIWHDENCGGAPPDVDALSIADEDGNASFRRLLQVLTPRVRSAALAPIVQQPAPIATPKPAPKPRKRRTVRKPAPVATVEPARYEMPSFCFHVA